MITRVGCPPFVYRAVDMPRDTRSTFWRLMNKPLFGTRVVPRDGRVDPAIFPEDEFPIHCAKCWYQLRGLSGDTCPECGEQFDRGRLLVQQYANPKGHPLLRRTQTGRVCRRLMVLAMTLIMLGLILPETSLCSAFQGPVGTRGWEYWLVKGLSLAGYIIMTFTFVLSSGTFDRGHRKRRHAILDAIDS